VADGPRPGPDHHRRLHPGPPLACALATFDPERILFSVDHPFADSQVATSFLRDAALEDADRERIASGNAEELLGI
jgi:hypothetical protein